MAIASTARTGIGTNGASTIDPPRGSEYATLLRQVKSAGLLDRRRGYYITKMVVTGSLLAAGWAVFVVLGDSWWQLLVAAFLAFVFAQLGFIGHDAGHRQIFRTGRAKRMSRSS
jgi:fatty acid desaturase